MLLVHHPQYITDDVLGLNLAKNPELRHASLAIDCKNTLNLIFLNKKATMPPFFTMVPLRRTLVKDKRKQNT